MELYSDATGCKVVVPKMNEAVLLGTAMAASVACGLHEDLVSVAVRHVCRRRRAHARREQARFTIATIAGCSRCTAIAPSSRRWNNSVLEKLIRAYLLRLLVAYRFRSSPSMTLNSVMRPARATASSPTALTTAEDRQSRSDHRRQVVLFSGRVGERQDEIGLIEHPVGALGADQNDLVSVARRAMRARRRAFLKRWLSMITSAPFAADAREEFGKTVAAAVERVHAVAPASGAG